MKQYIILFLVSITLLSCKEDYNFEINNLNNNQITVLGHGGMGIHSEYPLNSLQSITSTLATGADGTEIDVQMTQDCVLVAFHDQDLHPETIKSGQISYYTWDEIKHLQYINSPNSPPIVTLEQILASQSNPDSIYFTLDCKVYSFGDYYAYIKNFSNALVNLKTKFNLGERLFIEAKDTNLLNELLNRDHSYKLFYYPKDFDEGIKKVQEMKLYGITMDTELITADQVALAHQKNIYVTIWRPNQNSMNIDAIKKNPDFIQTDRLENLIKALK